MKNGTANHIGQPTVARKRKGKTPAPQRGRFPEKHGADKGCCAAAQGQEAVRAAGHAANGFLRCQFLPRLSGGFEGCNGAETEAGFYHSLALFCHHYGLTPTDTRQYGFPYSAALALQGVREELAQRQAKVSVEMVQDAFGRVALSATERFDTGYTLYYIPVLPLYRLMRRDRRKASAGLLLAACAYLYHIAGVPYYRQEGSYLSDQYGYIAQWVEEEQSEDWEAYHQNSAELRQAALIGDIMGRRIWNTCHLEEFEKRLDNFCIRDNVDKNCYDVAREFLDLWNDYPSYSLATHMPCAKEVQDDEEDYDDYGSIGMFQYISFSATTQGRLYETLAENINNEFNEYSAIEEPTITQLFDGRGDTGDTLGYELRLFAAIDRLCYLLNKIGYENN